MKSEDGNSCQGATLAQRKQRKADMIKRLSDEGLTCPATPTLPMCNFAAFPQYIRSHSIAAEYVQEALIGVVRPIQGAYGSVYLCRSRLLGTPFATKVVKVTNDQLLTSVVAEYETLAKLHHPHITSVYALVLDKDTQQACLRMDFLPGKSLGQLISEGRKFTGKTYEEMEVKCLARQLLSALVYLASEGLVHRDINPSNILLTDSHATLIDFQTVCLYLLPVLRESPALLPTKPQRCGIPPATAARQMCGL